MRKHHLTLGLALAAAVCALPTRAGAKPQTTSEHGALVAPAAPETTRGKPHPLTTASGGRAVASTFGGVLSATAGAASCAASVGAAQTRTVSKKRELALCFAAPVLLARTRGDEIEPSELSLTFCDGTPNPSALDTLSILARPRDVERPQTSELRSYQQLPVERRPREQRRNPAFVTEKVMRVHAGLLERLQKVAAHYPGRTLEIVSGHRPEARDTSRHHHGRALDFRVQGVTRERLRDFLRTFEETGVGYYPNSSFVHMDVREDRGYWVDRSGPGERADYGMWPPPRHEVQHAQNKLLAGALAELGALGKPSLDAPRTSLPATRKTKTRRPEGLRDEGDQMSDAEVKRIRADTLRALEGLR